MTETFPQNIKLGSLEIFKEDFKRCFDKCVQDRQRQLNNKGDTGSVTAFLPLLFNNVFNLSKMSLATILNKKNAQLGRSANYIKEANKELCKTYPVLQSKMTVILQNWRCNTGNIIERWQKDKNEIAQSIFNTKQLGNIISLGTSIGDVHEGGQQSLIIELSCGRKIAYKPRCLDLEQNFYRFAEKLGFSELYQPKYVSRKNYGWMEYIPHNDCESTLELADYYYQAGLILSLLYALEAEDIHHENVIAFGSRPVLIDLETLFHHRDDSINSNNNELNCLNLGNHTVLKTHFIPQYLKLEAEKEQAAIFPIFGKETPQRNSIPRLKKQSVAVNDYIDEFINGFKAGYRRLVSSKSSLLDTNGSLQLFSNCNARYICRATQVYSRLIQASSHPKHLACLNQQTMLFNKLKLDVVGRKFLNVLLNEEKAQIAMAQIPLFTHRLDQNSVLKADKVVDKGYFSMTGLELARFKILNMNEKDLEGQIQLIKHSFELVNPQPVIRRPKIVVKSKMNFKKLCENSAYSIGQFILCEGMKHQNGKIWPLFKFDGVERTCLEPTNSSLYDGYLGIQLFLAHLQKRFSKLCERHEIVNQTQIQINLAIKNYSEHDGCGFYGLGGILYALSQFGNLWPEEKWIKISGKKILYLMQPLPAKDDKFDIIGGSAGAILSLISYFKYSGKQLALDVASDFANNLLTHFQDKDQIGWQTNEGNVLNGFAHGNAGIGYALMQLAQLTPNTVFINSALAAMEFESNEYKKDIGNWPDRRFDSDEEQKKQAMTAWCHAVIGIGMSRLSLKKEVQMRLPDFIDRDIDRALTHLFNRPVINNEYLCHGNFGNFELLIMAKQRGLLNAKEERQAILMIAGRVEFIFDKGITQQNTDAFTSFALMDGWAGIGYQLLRFSQPETTPSILLLDS